MTTEQPKPCPTCGHCPTCGRSNQAQHVYPYWPHFSPYWPQFPPYWPQFPVSIACGNSTDGLLVTPDSETITINPNTGAASAFTGTWFNVTV